MVWKVVEILSSFERTIEMALCSHGHPRLQRVFPEQTLDPDQKADPSTSCLLKFFFFFFFLVFLGLHSWHMEVPRLGVKLKLELPAYAMAQQCQIWAVSVTYTIAHSNVGSLTHWVRPGIKPTPSWITVRFVPTEAR